MVRGELVVKLDASLLFDLLDDRLKGVNVVLVDWLHTEYDIAIHLHEATVRVPSEALVATLASQAIDDRIVESEVEDRVHHTRHRSSTTRAH